jgi:hypothetical protein
VIRIKLYDPTEMDVLERYKWSLSSDCSDHCPILLQLNVVFGSKRRFRFESFWTKLPGFFDLVTAAWACSLTQADPFRLLDYKFRAPGYRSLGQLLERL